MEKFTITKRQLVELLNIQVKSYLASEKLNSLNTGNFHIIVDLEINMIGVVMDIIGYPKEENFIFSRECFDEVFYDFMLSIPESECEDENIILIGLDFVVEKLIFYFDYISDEKNDMIDWVQEGIDNDIRLKKILSGE